VNDNPYNPLDYDNLTENLVRELMSRRPRDLPLSAPFDGPGVYALFYRGDFEHYATLCSPKADKPIYVGKAEPSGGRKGITKTGASRALYNRIKDHCDSISATQNLRIEDFQCRYLIVVPLWITMAERFLIQRYRPAWNLCLEGFGIHDPGSGRHEGKVSLWDLMHPGRSWGAKLRQTRTAKDAIADLQKFLAAAEAKKGD
jgi:hypothetical protein